MSKQTRKTKMLNFTKKYFAIHEYLMTVDNASEYVIELIKKDLENKKEESIYTEVREDYEKILSELTDIKEMLSNSEIKSGKKQISDEIKNAMVAALSGIEFDDE